MSITVLDEAPTNVILSTFLKSSVPWGDVTGISTIEGEFIFLQSGSHFGGRFATGTTDFRNLWYGFVKFGGERDEDPDSDEFMWFLYFLKLSRVL